MDVTLREVDASNWRKCATLEVKEEQRNFVRSVGFYLALCHYGGVWHPLAIYQGDEVVGFVMWAVDSDNSGWIGGLIIAAPFQGCGLGRAAVEALLLPATRPARLCFGRTPLHARERKG